MFVMKKSDPGENQG